MSRLPDYLLSKFQRNLWNFGMLQIWPSLGASICWGHSVLQPLAVVPLICIIQNRTTRTPSAGRPDSSLHWAILVYKNVLVLKLTLTYFQKKHCNGKTKEAIYIYTHSFKELLNWHMLYMSLVTRKPAFGFCDQVRLKPACLATEARGLKFLK